MLASAFAALLLIVGGSAVAVWRGASKAQQEVAILHNAHLAAGDALASIRANVFLSGILTRDYLLDPDPSHAARYSDQFNGIRMATLGNFRALAASGPSKNELEALDRLHREVDSYWDPTRTALGWTTAQKTVRRAGFLQERVRHREEIVELAAQVERMMTANFVRERARITSANERFASSIAGTTGIALLLTVGIAGATVARMVRLERQSESSQEELRRLSGQIRIAQEQERRYLSRELHDQAGQMLTGLRMALATISYEAGEAEFSERVAHARGIVEQTLRVIRNIAMMLRPSMLDDLGLASAVGWLVRDLKRSSGLEIHAEIDPDVDSLPDPHCTCVYRVVQEALTNAARHSNARRIEVSLSTVGGKISGTIVDDGLGFEAAAMRRTGLGLVGMEERVRELGGILRATSSPGQGARIEFYLPSGDDANAARAGEA